MYMYNYIHIIIISTHSVHSILYRVLPRPVYISGTTLLSIAVKYDRVLSRPVQSSAAPLYCLVLSDLYTHTLSLTHTHCHTHTHTYTHKHTIRTHTNTHTNYMNTYMYVCANYYSHGYIYHKTFMWHSVIAMSIPISEEVSYT